MLPDGEFDLTAQFDGGPNGLAVHQDRHIVIAKKIACMTNQVDADRKTLYGTNSYSGSIQTATMRITCTQFYFHT